MKVFVTGATGYIGSTASERLKSAGHDVLGLARSDEAEQKLKSIGIASRRGNLNDADSIARGADSADAVVHAALTKDELTAEADTSAVDAILGALNETGKTFIYTSGVLVYGSTGDAIADEDADRNALSFVSWRPELEDRILDYADQGVRTVVIRPGFVYGRGQGRPAAVIAELRDTGVARYVGDGSNRTTWVHVDDLADLYLLALEKAPTGSAFNGTVLPAISTKDFYEAAARERGRTESQTVEAARAAFGDMQLEVKLHDQQISGTKAVESLGWKPAAASLFEELEAGSYAT